MSTYLVGDLVAEFLCKCKVDTVFGMASVHNIPIINGISRQPDIRFIMVRGEMGGTHMADAFARVRGGLGVIVSSTGPGAANTAAGLAEARFAGSPVLHITGQSHSAAIGRGQGQVHDVPDQLGMLQALSKSAYRVRSAQEALGVLTRAAVDALSAPSGPVSVEIPIDIQRAPIERPAQLDHFVLPLPPLREPGAAELDELARVVAQARRPMLWLGTGARNAAEPARRLLDMGFGMVTSWAGRGVLPDDHPMNLGALNGIGAPIVESFYETVDLMIVAGSRVRGHETADFSNRLPKNIVQIDIDPLANGRTYANRHFVCGDGAAALNGLVQRLAGKIRIEAGYPAEFQKMKLAAIEQFRSTLGPYADFPARLRAAMPRDAIWVRDVTLSNSTWGNKIFPLYGPRDGVYPVGAGIGLGLSLGIGAAAAAQGRKVVTMTGDGGFFLNVGELWTAVQEKLDVVIIVMNDQGYGVIKHIQDSLYQGHRVYGDLKNPDLGKLAQLAEIPFWKVASAVALESSVKEALAQGGPALIEVDMARAGAFPPYYPYGAEGITAPRKPAPKG
jgi:acetolactate synthase-1/2/3 large subunit